VPAIVLYRRLLLAVVAAGGADVTLPGYTSGEEGDVTNPTVAITFSEEIVSALNDYVTGVTIKVNAVGAAITSGTRQAGNLVVYYVLTTSADANDTITWEYSDTLGDIADLAGNQLGDVTAQAVVNNVGTHLWFDNDADSMHLVTLGVL